MPDLSSRGARLDGRGLMFLDDDTIIGQVKVGEPDVWRICTRPAAGGPWSDPLVNHGASMIAARAGHWLAMLYGVRRPDGMVGPVMGLVGDMQSGRGCAAADGTIGVVLDYQAGLGLRLWAADGTYIDLPDARPAAAGVCVVDRHRALWMDLGTGQIEVCGGLPACHVLPGPFGWPTALELDGEWWIAYHSTDALGVVLHRFSDPTSGYMLALPPAYYLAAVALDGTRVKLAWSLTPDDATGREAIIDVAHDPRVPLTVPPEPPPPVPIPPPPKPGPGPTPEPPHPSPFPGAQPVPGVSMQVYLKLGNHYCGADPSRPGDLYSDRPKGAGWEEVELTRAGDAFFAHFVAADRVLSLTPDGPQTRKAGSSGPWESLRATTQPDGINLLYRVDGEGVLVSPVLTIEVR